MSHSERSNPAFRASDDAESQKICDWGVLVQLFGLQPPPAQVSGGFEGHPTAFKTTLLGRPLSPAGGGPGPDLILKEGFQEGKAGRPVRSSLASLESALDRGKRRGSSEMGGGSLQLLGLQPPPLQGRSGCLKERALILPERPPPLRKAKRGCSRACTWTPSE